MHNEKNRLRQQRYRERQKQNKLENNVTVTLRNDTIQKKKKKEEYKNKKKKIVTTSSPNQLITSQIT